LTKKRIPSKIIVNFNVRSDDQKKQLIVCCEASWRMVRGPVQRISANGSGRSRVKERMLDYPVPSVSTLLGKGIDTKA